MMNFGYTFLVALGLAMDCFAVSLGVGTSPVPLTRRLVFRITWHFGLFQAGMTVIGWLAGSTVVNLIANFDHWIAFILLVWVGGRMVFSGLKKGEEEKYIQDPSRGRSLVMLSIATSIDALAVGLSLALLQVNIVESALMIGITSTVLSLAGLFLGNRLSQRFGRGMEVLGGVVLIFIGIRIVASHLLGG
ncbi:MAG: manganese efflux pump MntP family protein [Chloroflexi bacterium]|nr:manganese efflux pump MntP family protein [Chloroflexota bacterium]